MNKKMPYKYNNDGFTLTETLVSITITLIISGCIFVIFSTSSRTISKAYNAAISALNLLRTDRFIRNETDKFHIAYWENASSKAELFKNYLLRSSYGRHIRKFELITSRTGIVRGIRVFYSFGDTAIYTDALFPSTPVMENRNEP
jgi:type II secretory pathway pseudopilin PulG